MVVKRWGFFSSWDVTHAVSGALMHYLLDFTAGLRGPHSRVSAYLYITQYMKPSLESWTLNWRSQLVARLNLTIFFLGLVRHNASNQVCCSVTLSLSLLSKCWEVCSVPQGEDVMWNALWLLGEKTRARMRDCKWLWKWRRLSPLGSAEWRGVLENVFLVACYMLESHTASLQWQPSCFFPNVCFLSFFLFQTPLRRWIYRLFLRAPLGKVIMWHWNARRTETLLPPASTSTLRWEITDCVHSNHASPSSPGSCCLPCILPYRLITPSLSLSSPFQGKKVTVTDKDVYTLTGVTRDDSGLYKCSLLDNDVMESTQIVTVSCEWGKRCFLLLYLSPISP